MSSFRKRNVQKPIPGTRTSPQTGQVITSSGNPSMDVILGGGLPIGSICLIEEDKYVTYSKVLAKYFLAEGIISEQAIFLGSLDDDPTELLHKLPKPLVGEELRLETSIEKECSTAEGDSNKNGLRIAWRYNDLPNVNSEQTTTNIGHHFNLLEQMDPLLFDFGEITIWNDRPQRSVTEEHEEDEEDTFNADEVADLIETDQTKDVEMAENVKNTSDEQNVAMDIDCNKSEPPPPPPLPPTQNAQTSTPAQVSQHKESGGAKIFHNQKYMRVLKEITGMLRASRFNIPTAVHHYPKSLCRICITSLASPLWYDAQFPKDILKFLTVLRAAVRSSIAVCFITIPMHLVAKCDTSLVPKIRNLVDFSIELESFAGSERETNPAFRDYNGLFHLHKISAINTLSSFMPETSDLAFKLRRKKFVIEKLHLPPELQDNSNSEKQADIAPTISCGSISGSKTAAALDF